MNVGPRGPRSSAGRYSMTTTDHMNVVRAMPRREMPYTIEALRVPLPRARQVVFKAGVIRAIGRMFVWLWYVIRFYSGKMLDVLLRRASLERNAVRLRRLFEDAGPTFIKLGQQLSMRVDMLPYAYCAELTKMLDRVPAFPTEQAIAVVERRLGKPLADVFESFDPEPIGSASLSCVYQARLKRGQLVAVKVRRPGIGPVIAADLRAMDWLLIAAETLTIIPTGIARRFRDDFETILFNELNFRAEARYTDLFRRRYAKRRVGVTAPRVYFQYCSEEVMVSEFVSGVWMWELMAAVDNNDEEFLGRMRSIGIEPKSVARKLCAVMQHEMQEELFFHGDPHPANLIIMPNNDICFIDFGAIGRFSTQTRKVIREFQHHMLRGDVGRMVNCGLTLFGRLPPLDVDRIRIQMDKIYSEAVYAMNSRDAEWWEKSSASSWLRFLEVARQFEMPANFEMIQLFRATFSYDSSVLRLDKDIRIDVEWTLYARQAAREARQRVQKQMRRRRWGLLDSDYEMLEQLNDLATQFAFQVQRNIENPIVHFRNIVGKIAYIASLVLKAGYLVAGAAGIALVVDSVSRRWFDQKIDWSRVVDQVTTVGWVQLAFILVVLVVIRRIVIRLSLPDTRLEPDR